MTGLNEVHNYLTWSQELKAWLHEDARSSHVDPPSALDFVRFGFLTRVISTFLRHFISLAVIANHIIIAWLAERHSSQPMFQAKAKSGDTNGSDAVVRDTHSHSSYVIWLWATHLFHIRCKSTPRIVQSYVSLFRTGARRTSSRPSLMSCPLKSSSSTRIPQCCCLPWFIFGSYYSQAQCRGSTFVCRCLAGSWRQEGQPSWDHSSHRLGRNSCTLSFLSTLKSIILLVLFCLSHCVVICENMYISFFKFGHHNSCALIGHRAKRRPACHRQQLHGASHLWGRAREVSDGGSTECRHVFSHSSGFPNLHKAALLFTQYDFIDSRFHIPHSISVSIM